MSRQVIGQPLLHRTSTSSPVTEARCRASRAGRRRTGRVRGASASALAALVLTACGSGPGSPDGRDGHLVYADNLTPQAAWATETDDAFKLSRAGCLETLVRYESDGNVVPGLATSWKQTAPTAWDFTLREDVTFQDGTAMNAEAVVGALTHVLQATAPSRSFNPTVVTAVAAVDEGTVRVTTPRPDTLLPLRMASPNTGVLAPEAYEGRQIDIIGTCTGPFTVVQEVPRQSLKLERNDDYWGQPAKLATAEVRFVTDGAARATQIQTGEAHIISNVPPAARSGLENDENVELVSRQAPRTTAMLLNNSRSPFSDPLVRKALQHAIDLDAIVGSVYEGAAAPAIGPFSGDDPWAPEVAQPVAFDPEQAKRLLKQAGVEPDQLSFELIAYNDRAEFADLAAVIQDQLRRIGVTVDIRTGEYAALEPDLLSGNYDAALLSRGYLVDIGAPSGYLMSDYTCEGSYNISQYCDRQTEALIETAAASQDVEGGHAIYARIAEKLQSDAVNVFLVHETMEMATTVAVLNFEIHPLSYYVLTSDLDVGGD